MSLGVVDRVELVELKLGAVISPFSYIETMSSINDFLGRGGRADFIAASMRKHLVDFTRSVGGAVLPPIEESPEKSLEAPLADLLITEAGLLAHILIVCVDDGEAVATFSE
jgi:hypothetical protein